MFRKITNIFARVAFAYNEIVITTTRQLHRFIYPPQLRYDSQKLDRSAVTNWVARKGVLSGELSGAPKYVCARNDDKRPLLQRNDGISTTNPKRLIARAPFSRRRYTTLRLAPQIIAVLV